MTPLTSTDTLSRLAELEAEARRLEPTDADRGRLFEALAAHTHRYLDGNATGPAFFADPDRGRALLDAPITEAGRPFDDLLALVHDHVEDVGLNPTSPRFFGYIPGGGLLPSAFGDFLAALTNRYAGVFFAGPGAVRMENQLIRWMADLVGFPETAGGYLSSGGSLANQTAIVAARDAHGIEGAKVPEAVVYLTEHAHHCVDKALAMAGLRTCVMRRIPVDARFRLRPDALADLIEADRAAGLTPWLVIASAGTTNTGTVDPLDAVGEVAEAHGLWYHIDAAYGGFFALCDEGRAVLTGLHRADSLVMDPHKTLFLPYGTGALLIKEPRYLLDAHGAGADYMQDTLDATEELSPADLSPELTKHFRGLRMWLPLQHFGLGAFRAALAEKIHLARYFHETLPSYDGFEVGPPPDLSVVTFRYVPKHGDADAFNERLVEALQADGRIFLSSTRLEGRFTLRFAVGCFRSHRQHVDEAMAVLAEVAGRLDA